MVCFVETDLYLAILIFVGATDGDITGPWPVKLCVLLLSIGGWLFWGLFIALILNKQLSSGLTPLASMTTNEREKYIFEGVKPHAEPVETVLEKRVSWPALSSSAHALLSAANIIGGVLLSAIPRVGRGLGPFAQTIRIMVGAGVIGFAAAILVSYVLGSAESLLRRILGAIAAALLVAMGIGLIEWFRNWRQGYWD